MARRFRGREYYSPQVSPTNQTITSCPNCGAFRHGGWCAECGQEYPREHGAFACIAWRQWHRIAHSLWALMVHPGQLTTEFRDGLRARSVTPWRLTFNVVALFLVLSFITNFRVANFPRLDPTGNLAQVMQHAAAQAHAEPGALTERLDRRFNSIYTVLVIVIVGARALAARLTHFRHPARWSVHFVFALYLTAWAFIATLVYLVALRLLGATPFGGVGDASLSEVGPVLLGLVELWQWSYVTLAFRRVYGDRWLAATMKAIVMVATGLLVSNALIFAALWLALNTV
jgi:Protein of unknown function (DUF3667)